MEVRATKPGYFDQYRSEGDLFEVPEGYKASWFEPTEAKAKAPAKDGAKAPAKDGAKAKA
ncbi:MAG: hypothetical protein ACKO0Z_13170 [Betaproteobacteria bacterium]